MNMNETTLIVMGCLLALMMTKKTKEYQDRVDEVLSGWLSDGDKQTYGRRVDYLRIDNGKKKSIPWTAILAVYDTTLAVKNGWALPEWALGDDKGRGPRAAVFLVDGDPDDPNATATMITQAIRKNIVRSMHMLAKSKYLKVQSVQGPGDGLDMDWLVIAEDNITMEFEIARDKFGQDGQEQTAPYRMIDCKVNDSG